MSLGSHVKLVSIIKAASQGQNLQIARSWFGWQGLRHFVRYLLIDHCHMNYELVFIGNSLSGLLVCRVAKHTVEAVTKKCHSPKNLPLVKNVQF